MPEISHFDSEIDIFCQAYAYDFFGNPGKAYNKAFGDNPMAADLGKELLSRPDVHAKIYDLRMEKLSHLAIDQTRIMELRLKVVYDPNEQTQSKLAALRDIEKSLQTPPPKKSTPQKRLPFKAISEMYQDAEIIEEDEN